MNWTDQDVAQITAATVGRAMSRDEFFGWVDAFTREHGRTPWQVGPFDAANNLIDHLIALGDSQRIAAGGAPVDWSALYYDRHDIAPGQAPDPMAPWQMKQARMGRG